MAGGHMKTVLVGATVIGLSVSSVAWPVSAQDAVAQCAEIFDKIACKCALQNGGRVIPPPVGVKREGLKLHPRESPESTQTLDGGRVAFPKYYRREGFKIRRSRALEGYLTCMHRNGRK
jgi:hypothetical protein